jgi:hypothetical protein
LNGQPDIEDFKASSTGEEPSAPSEPGSFQACALLKVKYRRTSISGTKISTDNLPA